MTYNMRFAGQEDADTFPNSLCHAIMKLVDIELPKLHWALTNVNPFVIQGKKNIKISDLDLARVLVKASDYESQD